MHFPNEEEKQVFVARLSAVKYLYLPEGEEKICNYELLSQLFSLAENTPHPHSAACPQPSNTINMLSASGNEPKAISFNSSIGKAM